MACVMDIIIIFIAFEGIRKGYVKAPLSLPKYLSALTGMAKKGAHAPRMGGLQSGHCVAFIYSTITVRMTVIIPWYAACSGATVQLDTSNAHFQSCRPFRTSKSLSLCCHKQGR